MGCCHGDAVAGRGRLARRSDARHGLPLPAGPSVVPFAAGGPADRVARAIAPALAKSLGQPLVVENRLGADGAIGAQSVLAALLDGYTLLIAGGSLVPLVLTKKAPPFDLRADFVPISKISPSLFAMYVSTQVPATSVAALVAHARAHPGELNVAMSMLNDFMAAARFMKVTGTSLTKVPTRAPARPCRTSSWAACR